MKQYAKMQAHVIKSFMICPHCKKETHIGAPPNLWLLRSTDRTKCDNCSKEFFISRLIEYMDVPSNE